MKTILYRGITFDNKWVTGDLIHGGGSEAGKLSIFPITDCFNYLEGCVSIGGFEIIPQTVGQFVGEYCGQVFFEGDIVKSTRGFKEKGHIVWRESGFYVDFGEYNEFRPLHTVWHHLTVLGTIHDNYLLKKDG